MHKLPLILATLLISAPATFAQGSAHCGGVDVARPLMECPTNGAQSEGARHGTTFAEKLASGQITTGALRQLISGTGLSMDEVMNMTLDDIVAIKWQDS